MRFLYPVCFLYIICFKGFCQDRAEDAFQFTEVVTVDSVTADLLFKRGKIWLLQNKYNLSDSVANTNVKADNELYVYQKGIASKKLHGRISYNIMIEFKDDKYRYTFSDFVFHYYKQNRYYEMVPTKQQKSLNDEKAAGWQNLWERHKKTTTDHIQQQITSLKNFMKESDNNKRQESKGKKEDF